MCVAEYMNCILKVNKYIATKIKTNFYFRLHRSSIKADVCCFLELYKSRCLGGALKQFKSY